MNDQQLVKFFFGYMATLLSEGIQSWDVPSEVAEREDVWIAMLQAASDEYASKARG